MHIGDKLGGWTISGKLGSGNQGETFVAEDAKGRKACLKLLTDGSLERRTRFAREAACFSSLKIDGIPSLLASNVIGPNPNETEPGYLCTELIQGRTLDRCQNEPIDRILVGVDRLLSIVHQMHSVGIVHRDIKPQNIIARDSQIENLWLVDFGLAFSSLALDDYSTEVGQELGNRFLRLPELHAGSRTKQDPVSDTTLCAGILFYLVTGIPPRTLTDEQGKMPHQRSNLGGNRLLQPELAFLLRTFDKGFRTRTDERFASASELRLALQNRATIDAMHQKQNGVRFTCRPIDYGADAPV